MTKLNFYRYIWIKTLKNKILEPKYKELKL